ncbi:hypothetical protein [Psychrobacter sp. I-STPA6b]|uniref:hypothetical protein n=1 Tax=Psychrobacter sp. I-STPA6b TaxID=2585718 RepID=UPI001D0C89A5|nr:hypothetical protein [Psychrobacter sp. I-STPA6b]
MNHFDDDDIDYDDEELMASLGIDDSNSASKLATVSTNSNQSSPNTASIFVAVNNVSTYKSGVSLTE